MRRHLLLFGWYRPGTGFTRVLEAVLPALAARWRVTWFGVGWTGDPFDHPLGARVLPTNQRGGDLVGAYAAARDWETLAPDAVLALNDLWYLVHYTRALGERVREVPLVGYVPIDGRIDDPRALAELAGFRELVTYTDAARDDLARALGTVGIDVPVSRVGHGVDLGAFRPLRDPTADDAVATRMQAAQAHFGLDEPAWVVLNAARPDPRKRIDLTLDAFARYAQGRPSSVKLALHHAIAHGAFVEPLRVQARALGIEERILWHPATPGPVDDAALNALYDACAIGLNTAAGEGFGLVSFEHAATAAPQLVPAQPALVELWGDAAVLLPARPLRTDWSPLTMLEVDVDATAQALAMLTDDARLWRDRSLQALARTRQKDLSWHDVGIALADRVAAHIG
jgi:glycosyltransferase involved in cell wall biosynthesis